MIDRGYRPAEPDRTTPLLHAGLARGKKVKLPKIEIVK
jgi:hypothetical protein